MYNGYLNSRYRQLQNWARAVLHAYDEFEEKFTFTLTTHIYGVSLNEIVKDLFGKPSDVKRKLDINFIMKWERI
jgi:hypothetical protein